MTQIHSTRPGMKAAGGCWLDRLNLHDVDGPLALFTGDAVIVQPRLGGLPDVYLGVVRTESLA